MPSQLTKEEFWGSLAGCPAVRHQVVEVFGARSAAEIVRGWCFESLEELRLYLRGPFLARVEMVAGPEAKQFVLKEFGRKAI